MIGCACSFCGMRTFAGLVVGVLIGTIASGGVFASLQQDATANGIRPTADKVQRVDRTHKGNRLNSSSSEAVKQGTRSPVKRPSKILIGCEPSASALLPVSDQAARCAT